MLCAGLKLGFNADTHRSRKIPCTTRNYEAEINPLHLSIFVMIALGMTIR
jgi:hypothetical protein